jgi:hypothetical protein
MSRSSEDQLVLSSAYRLFLEPLSCFFDFIRVVPSCVVRFVDVLGLLSQLGADTRKMGCQGPSRFNSPEDEFASDGRHTGFFETSSDLILVAASLFNSLFFLRKATCATSLSVICF